MVDLNEALKNIPTFNGGFLSEYYHYERCCEVVLNSVKDDEKPIILNTIIQQLSSEIFGLVCYRDILTWEELKERLRQSIMKYCLFCKSGYHNINECPKRFNQNMIYPHVSISANIGIRKVGELKRYIIDCTSKDFVPNTIKLLLNGGLDYKCSIVKISFLHGRVFVNEAEKRIIITPNEGPLYSYGSTEIHVEINGTTYKIKFDVVSDDSPIPEAGVIGSIFLQK